MRAAHDDRDQRRGILRRLTLVGPDGPFLDRWGVDLRIFGVYLHHVTAPDPGLDLHDHPWPFVSVVLSGGYVEERLEARLACQWAGWADDSDLPWTAAGTTNPLTGPACRGKRRHRGRWSVRRFRRDEAHRIIKVAPDTWTVVFRGWKGRDWGFYQAHGWVEQQAYDYEARRPVSERRPS